MLARRQARTYDVECGAIPNGERMTFNVGANKTLADFSVVSAAISAPKRNADSASNVAPTQVEQGKHAVVTPLT